MISPGKYNITAYQGATFDVQATWSVDANPVDLTNFTAAMQVRRTFDAEDAVLSLSDGAGITLGGLAGTIAVSVDAATMAELDASEYVYDLELDSGSEVTRLIQGTFTVKPEVTR
jgi:hypothetical protein